MKNRSRPFYCAIAVKTVGISLRHGGGLQEPDTVYVRCDERDCQYVDLNQDPCPLRPEMFADGSDRLVGGFVNAHAGERVCFSCLTEQLGITHDQVRRASWRLKDEPGMSIRPARCISCHRRRVTIGVTRSAAVRRPERATDTRSTAAELRAAQPPLRDDDLPLEGFARTLATQLRGRAGYSLCAHCLARELTADVTLVREAMWRLEPDPAFPIRTAQCVSCLLVKRVIRFEEKPADEDAPRRIIQWLVQVPDGATCATCLAFSTDLPLATVRRLLTYLEPIRELERRDGTCGTCGRWQPVVRFVDPLPSEAARVDEMKAIASGRIRHRGSRIDLLSFRVKDGWRPFALVKTGTGALVPDAPAIILTVTSTKLEADEVAAVAARAWIDKQTP
jgi:hypothetical protein